MNESLLWHPMPSRQGILKHKYYLKSSISSRLQDFVMSLDESVTLWMVGSGSSNVNGQFLVEILK